MEMDARVPAGIPPVTASVAHPAPGGMCHVVVGMAGGLGDAQLATALAGGG
ncbi:MAG: hypothetical protein ACRDRW_02000 [Pseudonocardiaceae bacterium]